MSASDPELLKGSQPASCNEDYAKQSYWNDRYSKEPSYDWFGTVYEACVRETFNSVVEVFEKQRAVRNSELQPLSVLHVGIGNSSLCEDLHKVYKHKYGENAPFQLVQVAVDYSHVVIEKMQARYADPTLLPNTHWVVADVRDLSAVRARYGPCFDLVVDKATMDALQVSKDDDMNENVAKMLTEVSLCLTEPTGGSGGGAAPRRFRRFIQMTWEIPYYRLYYTVRGEGRAHVWGSNVKHRYLGDSDLYRVYTYDVLP